MIIFEICQSRIKEEVDRLCDFLNIPKLSKEELQYLSTKKDNAGGLRGKYTMDKHNNADKIYSLIDNYFYESNRKFAEINGLNLQKWGYY